jgi:hypothetical protein
MDANKKAGRDPWVAPCLASPRDDKRTTVINRLGERHP